MANARDPQKMKHWNRAGLWAATFVYRWQMANGILSIVFSALTFLGVGLRLPTISWGLQISIAQSQFFQHPYLMLFPSAFLCVLVGAFILLGETLRDGLDPRVFGRG